MQIANMKDGGYTIDQSMVIVYWAVEDICPDQMGDKVHYFWADAVHHPRTVPEPAPSSVWGNLSENCGQV